MKAAVIQMNVVADKRKNLETMAGYVAKAADAGADIAILPEMFNCPYSNDYFKDYSEKAGGESCAEMSKAASENNIYVIGGSIPELDGSEYYNTSFVFDTEGREVARHRKVHLFNMDLKDLQSFHESKTFSAGEDITVFDTPFGKIGLIICFDIRFPEICRIMTHKGAQIIVAPGAFGMNTGAMHWEILYRTRAVDNQLFTIGVSPARDESSVYVSYANSIVVDPWGKVLYRADTHETMGVVDLDLCEIERARAQLPLLSAIRDDIYTIELR